MRDFRSALRFFLTQTGFRVLMIAATIAFFGVFVFAYITEITNKPPADLRAPFWEEAGMRPLANKDGQAGGRRLEIQHLSDAEVGRRLADITAESLSFSPQNYNKNMQEVQAYFTPSAYLQYQEFLTNLDMASVISRNYKSAVLFEQSPLQLSSGVYNGAYKWLYEVPIIISFASLSGAGTVPENRRFTLKAQLTRVVDPANPDAIKIEIWQIQAPRGR